MIEGERVADGQSKKLLTMWDILCLSPSLYYVESSGHLDSENFFFVIAEYIREAFKNYLADFVR